ncbi:MAG: SDR family oxidoreductase [Candidatus Thermoplasmatota archaeon]
MNDVLRPGLFAGKSVVVTGGSTGIGLAIAAGFKRFEADVHILSRKPEHLATASKHLAGFGMGRVTTHSVDVRDGAAVAAVAAKIGPVDTLINAAAGNFPTPFDAMSPNAWGTVVDIVLNGTANSCRAFRPQLQPGGSVLNIVAGYAWTGAPGVAHSGAAKAGVLNLTKSLAVEWAPLRVNAISPGPIDGTEGIKRLADDLGMRPVLTKGVPLGRMGQADEIAQAALWLASPGASFVSGACLTVDGAMDAKGPFGDLLTG